MTKPKSSTFLFFHLKLVIDFSAPNFFHIFVVRSLVEDISDGGKQLHRNQEKKTVKNQAQTFSFPRKGLGNIIISLEAVAICYAL